MEELKIGIIGLGYVGFPLACLMAKIHKVVGFDLSERRVKEIREGLDSTDEVQSDVIKAALATNLSVTNDIEDLRDCTVYIVAVPTPVDEFHNPDLRPLVSASHEVGSVLKKGDIVIYESTVYPGVTEEVCVPILAEESGLKYNEDFFAGYSPERINPGDKVHRVENIKKITSGSTPEAADFIDKLYNSVLLNGTYKATSIKVAEAAKVVENTQRDINIAFINEITMIFNGMGIDVNEVIDAAASKWNFIPFRPGLVGGHCIGVDPYYLIHRAELDGFPSRLISEARHVNDHMGHYIARRVLERVIEENRAPQDVSILINGFTFKPDCPDIRNTKVADVYSILSKFFPNIDVLDPFANPEDVMHEYGIKIHSHLIDLPHDKYDVIIQCVSHQIFKRIGWENKLTDGGFIMSLTTPYSNKEATNTRLQAILNIFSPI